VLDILADAQFIASLLRAGSSAGRHRVAALPDSANRIITESCGSGLEWERRV